MTATWKCKDGYCSITTNTERAWDELRAWMDEEGMAGDLMDPKYNDHFILRGTDVMDHIDGIIGEWAMLHSRHEIHEWGQSRHNPFGYAATPPEMIENPQLWDREFFTKVEHPELDATFIYPGSPYKLMGSPWKLKSEAPRIGQHNMEIYRDELGLSVEELEVLASVGSHLGMKPGRAQSIPFGSGKASMGADPVTSILSHQGKGGTMRGHFRSGTITRRELL